MDKSLKLDLFLKISKLVHRSPHLISLSDASLKSFPYFLQSMHAGLNFTVMLLNIQCIIIKTESMVTSSKFVFTAIRPLPKKGKQTYYFNT